MAYAIETSPEVQAAEKLAETARQNPEQLKAEIAGKTESQLDALIDHVEGNNLALPEASKTAIRERLDALKIAGMNANLDNLAVRLSNVKSLVPAQQQAVTEDPGFTEKFVASKLRYIAEMTKGIPVLGRITSLFGSLKGRDLERATFKAIALVEKAPGLVVSLMGGGMLSSVVNFLPSFNFGARKLAELDMKEATEQIKKPGEQISIRPITGEEYTAYQTGIKEQLAKGNKFQNINTLTKAYIELQRKNTPGAPMTVSLSGIQSTDELKATVQQKESGNRMTDIATNLGVSEIRFDETKTMIDNGVLYASEKDLNGKNVKPNTKLAALIDAKPKLSNATTIYLTETGNAEVAWEDGKKIARIPRNNNVNLEIANAFLAKTKPEQLSSIAIGNSDRIKKDSIAYSLSGDRGVLIVPNNQTLLTELEHKINNFPFGADVTKGAKWKLEGTEFVLDVSPMPAHS